MLLRLQFPINRTTLELKSSPYILYRTGKNYQSHHTGIEISYFIHFFVSFPAINRTTLELKLIIVFLPTRPAFYQSQRTGKESVPR